MESPCFGVVYRVQLKENILAFLSGYKTPSFGFASHSIDSNVCRKGFLYAFMSIRIESRECVLISCS